MKHLRKFEKYTNLRKKEEIIKESVLQVNDIYKVRTFIDLPQSLINSYVKKVKDTTGKNLRQFFGDVDIAEEIVKYINTNFLNVDKIPAGALMGDAQASTDSQGSTDSTQEQPQTPEQPQAQTTTEQPQAPEQPQAQDEVKQEEQPQVQVQAQSQENFEEVQKKEEGEEEKNEEPKEEGEGEKGTEELPG